MSPPDSDIFEIVEASGAAEVHVLEHVTSGLRAFIVIDDLRLGPAAGGIRTRRYPSEADALKDVLGLARSMTRKCALTNLDAGGGKCVVLDHDGLDRRAAFDALGAYVEELGGRFHTAGDLGTTAADLEVAAARSSRVHLDDEAHPLSAAVGTTVVASARASLGLSVDEALGGLRVGVQGVGDIGAAVTAAFLAAGAEVAIFDVDKGRAQAVAAGSGAALLEHGELAGWAVDLVAPCAVGGVLTAAVAARLKARAVVGGANAIVAPDERGAVASVLRERGVTFAPDALSSSGAVIVGVADSVMNTDPAPLLQAVFTTTERVLALAGEQRRPTWEAAEEVANVRLNAAGAPPSSTRLVVSRR